MDKVIIALFAFLGGAVFQNYRAARSEEGALINEHIKDIEKFSDAAQSYWLKTPKDEEEEAASAARVRVAHAGTTFLYEDISRICAARCDRYQKGMKALYHSATGGAFESAKRNMDAERAMATADCAAKLIHTLRVSRSDLLSIRHMARVIKWWFQELWRNHGPKP
ncbi:hypothetical protein EET67_20680 [Pseudaminobacter arsenicus]|uniref:Uncharacterized protein n=1 Tax=Borborobacter arsenicus TaxID=1851146 RepID=A0A432V1H3_9HYPH|nr:hypothetical protein [Pseudaminobacter arsenicus]RUM95938.1 hypothetical protein EET67_20680 [Pseudaminobacter arsenicus]